MAAKKVEDPWQNNHKFWGTLVDENGVKSYFVKLSSDAHFVSQGTRVEAETVFNSASEARDAVIKKLKDNNLAYIPGDDFPDGTYSEIKSIDFEQTTPLTIELNARTEMLFRDNHWLDFYGNKVGADAIRAGRQLPPLPKKG